MTRHNETVTLRNAVREYYDANALDDTARDRLMSGRPPARNPWLWAVAAVLAATLFLAGLGLGRGIGLPAAGAPELAATLPRLVAVQIRADWCPRTPEVGPIFAKLVDRYGNEPVLFVTLDITDDARREQAELLSKNLGIPQALEEPFGSGMIKLIDRERHDLLAAVTRPEQLEQLEVRIAEALEVTGRDASEHRGGGA